MATYYKYAERSADSQINWAEIGKDMSDMLKEETRIREQKRAVIDADFREGMKKFTNSPDGEHVGARQAALEFGDSGSKYMLTLNKLLKSGDLSLRDYTIKTQNLLDGTDTAFNALKEYQAVFGKKMERARTGVSSLYELRKMEQVEGFGDFSKSGFYINPPDGRVLIAKKTKKNVDGQDVYVMDSAPGELASVDYVKGLILGEWNKFDTNAVTDAFAKGLGEEMKSIQTQVASLSKAGLITSTSDITSRTDIDPATKKIMFKFIDAENQMIDGALANPFSRASVLTDNNIMASNGKLYDITSDPAKAKANPNLILEVIDSATGQGTLKFTPEQMKASQDFMRNQARAKYDYKEEVKQTAQTQLQERRPLTGAEYEAIEKKKAAKNLAQNLVYSLTGNANESDAGTKYLSAVTGNLFRKTKDGYSVIDENGNPQTFKFRADGKTLADPTKFVKSFIGTVAEKLKINQDDALSNFSSLLPKGARINETTEASGFDEDNTTQFPANNTTQFPFPFTRPTGGVGSKYN